MNKIMRALTTDTINPGMNKIMRALSSSLLPVLNSLFVLLIFTCIYATMAVHLFGPRRQSKRSLIGAPEEPNSQKET
jgi:hypothetical protein